MNSEAPLPCVLTEKEQSALLDQPDPINPIEHRNLAILMTLLYCGLRISELVALRWEHFDESNRTLRINADSQDPNRSIDLPDELFIVLAGWRDRQEAGCNKHNESGDHEYSPKSIFTDSTDFTGTAFSKEDVRFFLKQETEQAGIHRPIHPNALRHTFATKLYKKTGNIHRVHRALGNRDVFTTVLETQIPEDKLLEVKRKLKRSKDRETRQKNY